MGLVRSLVWGLLFVAAGAVVASGLLPGSTHWSTGPRVGIASLLVVAGLLVAGLALAPWVLRRTTKPADYAGGCPVGATCACGHFNFKPRKACKACGKATAFAPS